jgi:type IV secretory pathway protease TraF
MRRYELVILVLLLLLFPALLFVVRLNVSPSVPRGLYCLHRVPATVTYGQLVLLEVPPSLTLWWPHAIPLLKPVVGLPGDVLTVVEAHFYVNTIDYGPVLAASGSTRLPQVASPTVVGEGEVCLASHVHNSLDCRYSGPIPLTAIRAVATPLWVWEHETALTGNTLDNALGGTVGGT